MTAALHRTEDIKIGDIKIGDVEIVDIDTGLADPADLSRSPAEAGRRIGPPRRRTSVRPGGSTRAPRGPVAGEPTGPDAAPGAPRSGHLVTIAGGRAGRADLPSARGSAALVTSVGSLDVERGRIAPLRLGSAGRLAPSASRAGAPAPSSALRLTLRARRLIAAVALLCAAGVGVAAVDLLADVLPHTAANAATAADTADAGQGSIPGARGTLVSGQTLTVAAGDTLWSIAAELAPEADPREVVAEIMTLNGLSAPDLTAGQVLLLP